MGKKNIKILTQAEIDKELRDLSSWEQKGDNIQKQFEFESFMDAINFIYNLAPTFERIEHHADIHILFNKILFELQRFDVGGKITNRDIEVAHEIEKSFKEWRL